MAARLLRVAVSAFTHASTHAIAKAIARSSCDRNGSAIMTDTDLKRNVQSALDWEPSLDASDVGVSVDEAVVTLRGNVGSYAEQLNAERVVQRVFGVKAVANDLLVHIPSAYQRTDTEL